MNRFLLRCQLRAVLPNGVLLHSSAVAVEQKGYAFLAISGGGKSTIAAKLSSDSRFRVIADDSLVICQGTDGTIRCLPCGSMKQSKGTNAIKGAPLNAFFFVEKGKPSCIMPIAAGYAFYRTCRMLSYMAFGHVSKEEESSAMKFTGKLFSAFPSYLLRYDISENPVSLLEKRNL